MLYFSVLLFSLQWWDGASAQQDLSFILAAQPVSSHEPGSAGSIGRYSGVCVLPAGADSAFGKITTILSNL